MVLFRSWALEWGSTIAERAARYPAQDLLDGTTLYRGIDVPAPAEQSFRWLCQLKAAPYSYDLLDNRGRRSPRTLTEGVDELAVGQRVMRIFELVAFEPGRSLTLRLDDRRGLRAFGPLTATYQVDPVDEHHSRYVVALVVARWGARGEVLAYGDAFMMRKQLRTLASLAARA